MTFMKQVLNAVRGYREEEAIDIVLIALSDFENELHDMLDGGIITNSEYILNLQMRGTDVAYLIEIIRRTKNEIITYKVTEEDDVQSDDDGHSLPCSATIH